MGMLGSYMPYIYIYICRYTYKSMQANVYIYVYVHIITKEQGVPTEASAAEILRNTLHG